MAAPSSVTFIYGALRSGTTVFRLMLDAHPTISNPGEMDFLFDYLDRDPAAPTGWRYDLSGLKEQRIFQATKLDIPDGLDGLDLLAAFLDQLRDRAPGQVLTINIHRGVDRAKQALPDARFIHMLRDPRDVARSSIGMGWAGTLYHGVGHWIRSEETWDAAEVPANQTLTLRYEDLMEAPEDRLAEVCAFLDVPFDDAMLRYHENTTYGPPDPTLTYQWKRKSDSKEIAQLESRAGKLMKARGYAPTSEVKPSPVNKVGLALRNKVAIWRFGTRRYGLSVYWGEKISRWLGLKNWNAQFRERQKAIVIQHLK